jgi:hypothetical protein
VSLGGEFMHGMIDAVNVDSEDTMRLVCGAPVPARL